MLFHDAGCLVRHSSVHRNHPKILSPCHVSASWSPPLNVPSSVPQEHLHQQLLPFQGSTGRLGRQSTSAAADELAQGCADQELSRERSRRCSFAFSALKEEAERASPCSAIPSAGSTFPRSVQTLRCNSSHSLVTAKAWGSPSQTPETEPCECSGHPCPQGSQGMFPHSKGIHEHVISRIEIVTGSRY